MIVELSHDFGKNSDLTHVTVILPQTPQHEACSCQGSFYIWSLDTSSIATKDVVKKMSDLCFSDIKIAVCDTARIENWEWKRNPDRDVERLRHCGSMETRWLLWSYVLSGSDESSYFMLKRKEDRREKSTSTEPWSPFKAATPMLCRP